MNSTSGSIQSCIEIDNNKTVYDGGFQIYFTIDHIKTRNIPTGQYISFPTFSFADGSWALHYFPQGKDPAMQGINSSLFLVLLNKRSIPVQYFFKVEAKTADMNAFSKIKAHTFSKNKNISGCPDFIPKDKLDTVYCINGRITVCCNVRIYSQREFSISFPGDLQEHIENLWTKQEDFDVTFEVEGERISAHKIILSARSPVFKAELFGHMAEAKMNYIRIEDMEPVVFKALIYFIYTDKLDPSTDVGTCPNDMLEKLFVAADRYCLEKLKILCEQQLADNLSIDKLAPTLVLADRHNGVFLKKRCFEVAAEPNNFERVAFSDVYLQAMQDVPSLKDEFLENLLIQRNKPDLKRQRKE